MTPKENVILAYQHKKTPWIPNVFTDIDVMLQSTVNERYEGRSEGSDEFGVKYTYMEDVNAPMVLPENYLLSDIRNWREEITFPQMNNYDWEKGAVRDTAGWQRNDKFSVVMMYNGPLERLHALMGFENALMAVFDYPDAVNDFFQAFTDYRIKLVEHIRKYYHPDSIMIFDDYGANTSMLISPNTWREIIKPHIKRIISVVHECGMYYTLHSCGYIKPIFEDFIEIGADAVHPVQYINDVVELKKQYGSKITFTGGFNTMEVLDNPTVDRESIEQEVSRVLREIAVDGSYIIWQTVLSPVAKKIFIEEIVKQTLQDRINNDVPPPESLKVR